MMAKNTENTFTTCTQNGKTLSIVYTLTLIFVRSFKVFGQFDFVVPCENPQAQALNGLRLLQTLALLRCPEQVDLI